MLNRNAVIFILLITFLASELHGNHRGNSANNTVGPQISSYPQYHVKISKDIVFGKALSHHYWNSSERKEIDLHLDIYQPEGLNEKRPVIFLFYGGGFEKGNKEDEHVVNSALFFASHGFIAIAPNYRVASDYGTLPDVMYKALLKWPDFMEKDRDAYFAMYPASRDGKAAVRWLYANADIYQADTNYITSLGNSAGGLISAVLGVSEAYQFRDEVSLTRDPTLEKTFFSYPSKIHTVINRWGGPLALDMQRIFFGEYPYDHHDAPMQMVHGTIDTRVPFTEALRFVFNYQINDIDYEIHPLHWIGHHAAQEKVNGVSHDELALQFIISMQNLAIMPKK